MRQGEKYLARGSLGSLNTGKSSAPLVSPEMHRGKTHMGGCRGSELCVGGAAAARRVQIAPRLGFWVLVLGQQVVGSSALRNEEFAAPSSLPGTALWDKLSLINLLLGREHLCYKLIRRVVKYHKHLCPH